METHLSTIVQYNVSDVRIQYSAYDIPSLSCVCGFEHVQRARLGVNLKLC